MHAKSIGAYFFFGTVVRYLQDVTDQSHIHGPGFVRANLEALFRNLKDLNLQVTLRASGKLAAFAKSLETTEPDALLTNEQASTLQTLVRELRLTLEADLGGFTAYVVTPKRLETSKLLGDVSALFPPDIFAKLPSIAAFDFTEAGKCIAFERPTAAAFHLLRGTEDTLRTYYRAKVKRNRGSLMWGPIVTDLSNRRNMKGKEILLNNLDNIRLSFRNPTQHPEKIYDIQEAQELWGLCVEVVSRMMRDLAKGT